MSKIPGAEPDERDRPQAHECKSLTRTIGLIRGRSIRAVALAIGHGDLAAYAIAHRIPCFQ